MRVFFLSDLHIESGSSPSGQRFSRFLREVPGKNDVLILGGDIFDLLIGNKRVFQLRYEDPLNALKELASRGVSVYYLEGNHDFHFEQIFSGIPNFYVHEGDVQVSALGRKIWVSHGDLIDPEDTGYRLLRFILRNVIFKAFVAALPDFIVDFIGSSSSGASRKYTNLRVKSEGTDRLREIYLEYARKRVRSGFHHVLVGHSHLKDQISIVERDGKGEYLNLGYDGNTLLYAVLEEGAESFQSTRAE